MPDYTLNMENVTIDDDQRRAFDNYFASLLDHLNIHVSKPGNVDSLDANKICSKQIKIACTFMEYVYDN